MKSEEEEKKQEEPALKTRSKSRGSKEEQEQTATKPRSQSRGAQEGQEQPATKPRSQSRGAKEEQEQPATKPRSQSRGAKEEQEQSATKPRSQSRGAQEEQEQPATKPRSQSRGAKEEQEQPATKPRSQSRDANEEPTVSVKSGDNQENYNEPSEPARGRRDAKKETASSRQKEGQTKSEGVASKKKDEPLGERAEHRSKSGSRQTSRTGSPISILKKGGSRDASKDRSGLDVEDIKSGKPVSRSGSLKKSASFNKKAMFAEKKKISFDEDVDIEKFDTENEPLNSAKEIFAAIANTSLDAGLTGRSQAAQKSRDSSGDRTSRTSSRNDFSPAEPADYFPPEGSEIDNEDELMIIIGDNNMMDDEDQELAAIKSRSQSRERPGFLPLKSRRGSDDIFPKSLNKSRSGSISNVPELETIQDEILNESSVKISISQDLEEEPRPASTGYTHLDEFERKLIEMESELVEEVAEGDMAEHLDVGRASPLRKASNTWDLSPQLNRARENEEFSVVAEEFKASVDSEDIYAKLIPKSQRPNSGYTDDGYVINTERELADLDHSGLKSDDLIGEEECSEYIYDMTTGEQVRRSKKVSFAEYEEKFEIERDSQIKSIGLSKLFGFGPPKPMKPLPGKEKKSDNLDVPTETSRSSKEPSPITKDPTSPKAFLAAMTSGLMQSKSPETSRKDQSGLSVFGSLLRKGRKSSRSGSKSGSRTSSAERGSQELGSEDNEEGSLLRTSTRGSNYDDEDARSDSSFAQRLGLKKKKKAPKESPQSYLFPMNQCVNL